MHVRVRIPNKTDDSIVVIESKLTKIEEFRTIVKEKFGVEPKLQRLLYGGKLLENGYTFHDYNIKLNNVIQLFIHEQPQESPEKEKTENSDKNDQKKDKKVYKDAESTLYAVGDLIDVRDQEQGAWFEGKIAGIVYDPDKVLLTQSAEARSTTTSGKDCDVENNTPTDISLTENLLKNNSSKDTSLSENSPKVKSNSGIKDLSLAENSSNIKKDSIRDTSLSKVLLTQSAEARSTTTSDKDYDVENNPPTDISLTENLLKNNSSKDTSLSENSPKVKSNSGIKDLSLAENSSNIQKDSIRDTSLSKVLLTQSAEACSTTTSDNDYDVENNPPTDISLTENLLKNNSSKDTSLSENSPKVKSNSGIKDLSLAENSSNIKKDSIKDTSLSENSPKTKKNNIKDYFNKIPKSSFNVKREKEKEAGTVIENFKVPDEDLLYKVLLDADDEEDSYEYCKLKDIRPRARQVIDPKDLQIGQTVMINYNTEALCEKGYWYDYKVTEIKKFRVRYELMGTLYLGPDAVPQNDTRVKVHDKIFAIEEVVPLAQRTGEYSKMMNTDTEIRTQALNCLTCRDVEDTLCKDCGCSVCYGKQSPEKIVLCDECNKGFHMHCVRPQLTEVPEDDWYCLSCKRDPSEVIAPGAMNQVKKASTSKSNRDWGRGMACVGKTKTCSMPANHFGPIPGIEVGMCWRFRIQLSETGVHRPPVSGIHGRDVDGAYSIVLSGGYEDDYDNGNEFTYTGSGGRDLSGNKRTAEQSCDQTFTRENKALARNCAVKQLVETGADAGDNWRNGKPVRVVRSYKMMKHFPKYAPSEGIRYDGIYKVVKYYPEKGQSGFRVWKYLLRRDDPIPAPWEPGAKTYPIIYPDGYLEAEAEKKALKTKRPKGRGKQESPSRVEDSTDSSEEASPPAKKRKTGSNKKSTTGKEVKITSFFKKSPTKNSPKKEIETISAEERTVIEADILNSDLWKECLIVYDVKGKRQFVEHVSQMFICIICQDVAANPTTTPCLHNFCMVCLKLAIKSTNSQTCPFCRQDLSKSKLEYNSNLKAALQAIMPGYDAGKK